MVITASNSLLLTVRTSRLQQSHRLASHEHCVNVTRRFSNQHKISSDDDGHPIVRRSVSHVVRRWHRSRCRFRLSCIEEGAQVTGTPTWVDTVGEALCWDDAVNRSIGVMIGRRRRLSIDRTVRFLQAERVATALTVQHRLIIWAHDLCRSAFISISEMLGIVSRSLDWIVQSSGPTGALVNCWSRAYCVCCCV